MADEFALDKKKGLMRAVRQLQNRVASQETQIQFLHSVIEPAVEGVRLLQASLTVHKGNCKLSDLQDLYKDRGMDAVDTQTALSERLAKHGYEKVEECIQAFQLGIVPPEQTKEPEPNGEENHKKENAEEKTDDEANK